MPLIFPLGRTVSLIAHVEDVQADAGQEADSTQRAPPRTDEDIARNIERHILEVTEAGIEKVSRRYCEGTPHEALEQEVAFLSEFNKLGRELIGSKKDSIKLELTCPSKEAVDDLLDKFKSGFLLDMFHKTFATSSQKRRFGAKEVNFSLELDEDEFRRCRNQLPRRGK